MKVYPLETILATAKELSPYYNQLYKDVDLQNVELSGIPLTVQDDYWEMMSGFNMGVLTGEMTDGIVFKSGGTTGNPKFTVYTKQEWATMTEVFGYHQALNKFRKGDRVANLFYVGELYSSFLFLHDSMRNCTEDVIIFPIAGSAPKDFIYHAMHDLKIDTVLVVPTTILNLAEWIHENNLDPLKIKKVYFGGETMYPDQREILSSFFPGVEIRSIGYASVDGGLLGFCDESCGFNEHRIFDGYNIIELINEDTGEVIDETGVEGKMHTTNLSRLLMPVIRYPIGDMGVWKEPLGSKNRKFEIKGRSEECARFGPVSLYFEDIRKILGNYIHDLKISNYQMIIDHTEGKDKLTIKIASETDTEKCKKYDSEIINTIETQRALIKEEKEAGKIHPIEISWVDSEGIQINPRTGKLKRIIDNRF
ncbi:phenylacetate--CoA ligase family protein [Bacteroidota bacterium]